MTGVFEPLRPFPDDFAGAVETHRDDLVALVGSPRHFVQHLSYEDLIGEFEEYESTEYWARGFKRCYLDLAPVL